MPDPHPHFESLKAKMWEHFATKDYENAARTAATIVQDSYAFDAIHVAGLSLTALDRMEEGFDWCCASLSLANAKADWYSNCAQQFLDKKDFPRAMIFVENGIKDRPGDIRLHFLRGLIFCYAQDWEKAIGYLDEAIALDSGFYHSYMSKGFCLHMLGRYDEAMAVYALGIPLAIGADLEEMINNVACLVLEQGRPQEALDIINQHYEKSIKPGTIYNKSFLFLGTGRWPDAWHMYRRRMEVQINGDQGVPRVDQPVAKTLKDVRGSDFFLFHEQGLGDSLMFLRFAKWVRPLVNSLVIGVPKTMHRLTECMDIGGDYTVVSDGAADAAVLARCDLALPMLDVPALFNLTTDQIPGETPYFHVPNELIAKRRLPDNGRPRIGLCWAGASRPDNMRAHSIDKRRSIPFELMEPILSSSDLFDFYSLQMPDHRPLDDRLYQLLESDFDVLDTMAIIEQLDLVITIDSSVCHMAGALGRPVWMLSQLDGCWRWFWDGRSDSPWYPTMRIYRQQTQGAWLEVIDRVADDLDQLVPERHFDERSFQEAQYGDL